MTLAALDLEFPTIKAELERKTIEEVQRLAHDFKTCRISHDAFKACLQTLWNCSAGLVDKSTMEIISALINQPSVNEHTDRLVRVLCDETGWHYVFAYRFGDDKALMDRVAPDGSRTRFELKAPADEIHPQQAAQNQMLGIIGNMLSAGFKSIA